MSVPQQLVLETVAIKTGELEERCPGYQQDVLNYLADILSIERAAPHNVMQQVEAQLEAFADLYRRKIGDSEAVG